MDATRSRRTRDAARRRWYSHWRSLRFARHMGFPQDLLAATGDVPRAAAQDDKQWQRLQASAAGRHN